MSKVNVIDCGLGNLNSMVRALERTGVTVDLIRDPSTLADADKIILPGVGAFSQAMIGLRKLSLDIAMKKAVLDEGIPFLGICVGMQAIAGVGSEGSEVAGLDWIEGKVRKLQPTNSDERIPHLGWNSVIHDGNHPLFKNIAPNTDFYFANSYHFDCVNHDHVVAMTPYCGEFVSTVAKNNIFGVQFHPEKSQKSGLQFLKNFIEL